MPEKKGTNQCAHPGCNCTAPQGEKYCSPHCRTAPPETMCGCGHAGCGTGVTAQSSQGARS